VNCLCDYAQLLRRRILFRGGEEPVPDFLQTALDTTAFAVFVKESRINVANANQFHRKSGVA
jgi:hypothetical protein